MSGKINIVKGKTKMVKDTMRDRLIIRFVKPRVCLYQRKLNVQERSTGWKEVLDCMTIAGYSNLKGLLLFY